MQQSSWAFAFLRKDNQFVITDDQHQLIEIEL